MAVPCWDDVVDDMYEYSGPEDLDSSDWHSTFTPNSLSILELELFPGGDVVVLFWSASNPMPVTSHHVRQSVLL